MKHTTRRCTYSHALALAAGLTLAGLAACSGQQDTTQDAAPEGDPAAPGNAALVENGRDIVETQCASCHAVGTEDESQRADAPPLRTVLADYDPGALADDFREGIHVGHPDMPDFNLGPKGTESVLAYLLSIREQK